MGLCVRGRKGEVRGKRGQRRAEPTSCRRRGTVLAVDNELGREVARTPVLNQPVDIQPDVLVLAASEGVADRDRVCERVEVDDQRRWRGRLRGWGEGHGASQGGELLDEGGETMNPHRRAHRILSGCAGKERAERSRWVVCFGAVGVAAGSQTQLGPSAEWGTARARSVSCPIARPVCPLPLHLPRKLLWIFT